MGSEFLWKNDAALLPEGEKEKQTVSHATQAITANPPPQAAHRRLMGKRLHAWALGSSILSPSNTAALAFLLHDSNTVMP